MLYLLCALARQLQLSIRGLLSLLDKGMQNHYAFAQEKAVERPTDPGMAVWP
jgi:hypothetical protein